MSGEDDEWSCDTASETLFLQVRTINGDILEEDSLDDRKVLSDLFHDDIS